MPTLRGQNEVEPSSAYQPAPWPRFIRCFAPPRPAPPLGDPTLAPVRYARWRNRVLISSLMGYAVFYLVRKNLGIAMPVLEKDLGIAKTDLGWFLTLHGVLYGLSKFANGFLGDRCHARTFMVAGLLASALMNVFFGLSAAAVCLGIFWMLNGWFQGMGFPPCGRLMAHWFPPKQLATKMCVWNTSHSIGAGLAVVLCGYLALVNWRLAFLVPALVALVCCVFLWFALPDTPASVGLPELPERTAGEGSAAPFSAVLLRQVFKNRIIWLLGFANFFVYAVRYAVLDWGPTLLVETKHLRLTQAGWTIAAFEVCGAVGMLLSGWLTDRVFGGRGARACLVFMALSGCFLFAFWKLPAGNPLLSTAALCAAGFFIYGPQALVGITAANLATRQVAASAIGFTGLFAYASTVLSGWGLGALVQHHGWNAAFTLLMLASIAGVLLFALAWPAKPHGYSSSAAP